MVRERKTSGTVVLIGWAIVAVMALFFVDFGENWYSHGHLRLCVPEDSMEPPFGHYQPPEKAGDLLTPPYWCAWQAIRACKPEDSMEPPFGHYQPPEKARDLLTPPYWCALQGNLLRTKKAAALSRDPEKELNKTEQNQTISPQKSEEDIQKQLEEANQILLEATVNNYTNEIYRGSNSFFGNTAIDYFFENVFRLFYRWLSEILNPLFNDTLIPAWNEYFAGDDPAIEGHRTACAYVATILFGAVIGVVAKTTFDWLHEIAVG